MPFIKLGEYKIDSERLGFPSEVTPTQEQFGQKVDQLLTDNKSLTAERDGWRERSEKLLAENKSLHGAKAKLAEAECDAFLESAKNAFKIDAVMIPHLRELWKKDEKSVRTMVDALRAKAYLAEEQGIRGSAAASDPVAEVTARAAEMVANDPERKLTMSEAQFKVLGSDPALSARYREATVVGVRKGGDV